MTIQTTIQSLLEEKGYLPTFEKDEDRLLVPLKGPGTREDLLEIKVFPQTLEGDIYFLLQFQLVVPVDVLPETVPQVSSSLHFFNRLIHCPGFEFDELSNQVFYRYAWFMKKTGIDAILLQQVISNLHLCFSMFSPYIQEIAAGKYTLEDILEKVIALKKTI